MQAESHGFENTDIVPPSSLSLVLARHVLIHPSSGAVPPTIRTLLRSKATALARSPEGRDAVALAGKRDERHEPLGSGYRRDEEPVEVVGHRSGDQLSERSEISLVGEDADIPPGDRDS